TSSWPCSFKIAAAADESTPPLIATAIFISLDFSVRVSTYLRDVLEYLTAEGKSGRRSFGVRRPVGALAGSGDRSPHSKKGNVFNARTSYRRTSNRPGALLPRRQSRGRSV